MLIRLFGSMLVLLIACSDTNAPSERVLGFAELKEITIERAQSDRYTLSRENAHIHTEKVNALFASLASITLEDGFEPALDSWSEYGLENPDLTVTLDTDTSLSFGAFSNFAGKRYARINSENSVYLLDEELFQKLNKSAVFFVDEKLINFNGEDICSVRVITPEGARHFARDSSGWEEARGESALPLSTEQVESLLKTIKMFSSKEEYQGAEIPELKYRFHLESCAQGGPGVQLAMSGVRKDAFDIAGPALIVATSLRDGKLYQIERRAAPVLDPSAMSFKRQFPFKQPLTEVFEAQLLHSANPRVLKRRGDSWLVNGEQGDPPFVEAAIAALLNLEAIGYPEQEVLMAELSKSPPLLDFRILDSQKGTLVAGKVWQDKSSKRLFAADQRYSELFEIDAKELKKAFPRTESLFPVG